MTGGIGLYGYNKPSKLEVILKVGSATIIFIIMLVVLYYGTL